MSERRRNRSNSNTSPVLDQRIAQRIVGPQIALNTLEILDLSRSNVATKLGMAPAAYSPVLQGDLLTELPNLASLDLRDYNWRSVDLFSESRTLRKLDLRGNQVEASALKRLLSLLPGLELLWLSDVPFKHPTELFLALHHSPGPSLSSVPRSLKIRITAIERTWSALLNEMTRVKALARNAVDKVTLDDDTRHVVIEELPVEELKQKLLQRLQDPNKEKEGYKQMYDNIIHERATTLASGQSARVKTKLMAMDDSAKRNVEVHVSNCGSECKCHSQGLSLDWLPSEFKTALQSAMSVKPVWHKTRTGHVIDRVSVGRKRPRADTAQVRAVSVETSAGKSLEHVTLTAGPDTLAHVIKCRTRIGQYREMRGPSKDIERRSVVHHFPRSRANHVPFNKLSPHEKLEAVDLLLKTVKL